MNFSKYNCLTKYFILNKIFIMIITVLLFLNANISYSETCCYYIEVTPEIINDSCCVKINVYNPVCDSIPPVTAPLIHFLQYNSGIYEEISSLLCPKGETVFEILCPVNGETEVKYRILIDHPQCLGPYREGYTMRTGTIDLSSCCECPENPEERNSWVTVDVHKDPSCPNNGCEVTMNWNIPDSITCFKYYMIEDIYGNDTPILSTTGNPISEFSYCLNAGQSGIMYFVLLQSQDQDIMTGCIIEKYVECDSSTSADTVAMPCTPDCEEDLWHEAQWLDPPIQLPNGCVINVKYTFRIACEQEFQDLQLIDIRYANCGNMTEEEIFQEALKQLISRDPMGFQPIPGHPGCNDMWRIVNISCWRINIDIGDPPPQGILEMRPCEGCCWQYMRVCRDASDNVTVTPLGPITFFGGNCASIPPYPSYIDPNKCYVTCSWISIVGEIQPMGLMIQQPDNLFVNTTGSINFTEKITDGILNVTMTSNCGDLIRVDISDVYGSQLKSYEQSLKTKDINISINTNDFDKGYYVYKIYCNGTFIGSSKFSVE